MWKQFCKNLLTTRSVTVSQVKTKIWSKQYVEPIVTKDELENIKENDAERFTALRFNKIVALNSFKNNNEFYDEFLVKLVGKIVRQGARERADRLIKETLFLIKKDRMAKCRELSPSERENFVRDPIRILKDAWANIQPIIQVRQVTRAGAKYFAPVPVMDRDKDKITFAWVREIIENRPRPRPEKFPQVFSRELLLAYKNEGKLIKKKLDLYRLCEANKAYVNYVYMRKAPRKTA